MGIQKIVIETPLQVGSREILLSRKRVLLDAQNPSAPERNLLLYGDEQESALALIQGMTGLREVRKGLIEYEWNGERMRMERGSPLENLFAHQMLVGYVSEMGLDFSRYFTMLENMHLSKPRHVGNFEERVRHYAKLLSVEDHLERKPQELDVNVLCCFSLIKAWAIEPDILIYFEPLSHIDNTRDEIVRKEIASLAMSPDTISIIFTEDFTDFPGFDKLFQQVDLLRKVE